MFHCLTSIATFVFRGNPFLAVFEALGVDLLVRVQCFPGKSSGPRQAGFRPERRLANRDAAAGKARGALEELSPNGTEENSPGLGNLTAEDKQLGIERVSQAGQGGRQRRGGAPNDCLRHLVARASGGKNIQAGQGCRSFSESFAQARLASAADSRERVTLDGPGREDSFQAAAIAANADWPFEVDRHVTEVAGNVRSAAH